MRWSGGFKGRRSRAGCRDCDCFRERRWDFRALKRLEVVEDESTADGGELEAGRGNTGEAERAVVRRADEKEEVAGLHDAPSRGPKTRAIVA